MQEIGFVQMVGALIILGFMFGNDVIRHILASLVTGICGWLGFVALTSGRWEESIAFGIWVLVGVTIRQLIERKL